MRAWRYPAVAVALAAGCGGSAPPPAQAAPARTTVFVGPPLATPAPNAEQAPADAGADAAGRGARTISPAATDAKNRKPTPLGAARKPFAKYITAMHNRIHPLFTDSFLASLDKLPPSDPLNKQNLHTALEIVLDNDGHIASLEVYESSGVAAFDAGVVKSIRSAAPFGKPPPAIVSGDGRVYLHWKFWRSPYYACSTYFSRPFYYPPEAR